jgi:hypothetical protein
MYQSMVIIGSKLLVGSDRTRHRRLEAAVGPRGVRWHDNVMRRLGHHPSHEQGTGEKGGEADPKVDADIAEIEAEGCTVARLRNNRLRGL